MKPARSNRCNALQNGRKESYRRRIQRECNAVTLTAGVLSLHGGNQVLFGQDPIFQSQWVIRKLVAEHFKCVLPHHCFCHARSECGRLFDDFLFLLLFHNVLSLQYLPHKGKPESAGCNWSELRPPEASKK